MSEESKIDFWNCDEDEDLLTATTKEDAIREYIDLYKENPKMLYGFKRGEVNREGFVEYILELAYDYLSESYDGDDGHEQNDEVKKAAESFIDVYLKNYKPWQCVRVVARKINEEELINENL